MIVWKRAHEIEDEINKENGSSKSLCDFLLNGEELHYAMTLYNWDDEYTFPILVLNRKDCDLGTILLMFEMIVEDPEQIKTDYDDVYEKDLKEFSLFLREKWNEKNYPENISYEGSPGEELIIEWKRRYTHYGTYPDENPNGA